MTSGCPGPAGCTCQTWATVASASAGNLTFPVGGSDHVAPRSSLARTTVPQCWLVQPAKRRVRPPRVSTPTEYTSSSENRGWDRR